MAVAMNILFPVDFSRSSVAVSRYKTCDCEHIIAVTPNGESLSHRDGAGQKLE
jgi:hypothetical protein